MGYYERALAPFTPVPIGDGDVREAAPTEAKLTRDEEAELKAE